MTDYTLKMNVSWTLDEKQNEIVEFLLNNDFAFNCAQTGLGKTITTLTAAIHTHVNNPDKDYHFILLLPNAAVKAFTDTLGKILNLPYNIYTATATNVMPNARFHIFNYSTVGKGVFDKKKTTIKTQQDIQKANPYLHQLMKLYKEKSNLWLIADEAHALQDPSTIQYRVVEGIRTLFKGIWFLTATPILNDVEGFYHMTDLLVPGFFGNVFRFKNKYCVMETRKQWVYNPKTRKRQEITVSDVIGYKNMDHLKEEFNKIAIIRANQYNIQFNYRSAPLSDYMEKFYKLALAGLFSGKLIEDAKGKKKTKKSKQEHVGARLHDMQRVVSNSHKDFQAFDRDEATEKEFLLIKTIREVMDRNEAVLIYFSYLETLDRVKYILDKLANKLGSSTIHIISGAVKQSERKLVEANIKPKDIVLITSAGTESINLQKSNNLIFYEIPFALRHFIQACGRIARTDSKFDTFNVYLLEAEGTIDTYKKNRIIMNAAPIKSVLGGSNTLPTETLSLSLADKQAMKDELLWWNMNK
mgnify:CR=1 FL=1